MQIEETKKVIYVVNKNIPKWPKKKLWCECTEKEKDEANLMEIPTSWVILDYESEEDYKRGKEEVLKFYNFFEIWDTHSKEHPGGKHIILKFSNLSLYDLKTRNEIRRLIIKKFKSDESKHSEKTFIPIPLKPHYKSGEVYSLVEKIEGINRISDDIITQANEINRRNLQIQSSVNPSEDFNDYFEKDILWKELNSLDWAKMPRSCGFNNIISKNLAIASAKTGKSKEVINEIIKPFMTKIKGYNYASFEGWLKKAFQGELDDYNYYELNKWSSTYLKKEIYKNISDETLDAKIRGIGKVFTRIGQAEEFIKHQPVYYEVENGQFWLWDFEKFCWMRKEKTIILNAIRKILYLDTINSKIREEILEALREVGAENKPKPTNPTWVQFKDKIYDIKTGEEFKATPEYFVANPINWKVGESEKTPIIDKLFNTWVKKEDVQRLYEIIAFVTVPEYFIHSFFFLYAPPGYGKGTFMNLLFKFIGEHNYTSTSINRINNNVRFETKNWFKKLLVTLDEVSNAYELTNSAIINGATGDSPVPAEFKGSNDDFKFKNYAKFIYPTNKLLKVDENDGFGRRVRIIKFVNRFEKEKDVIEEIPDEEYENLSKKCLRIAKELWERRQFTGDVSISERMKSYQDISKTPLETFIDNYCDLTDSEAKLRFDEFYSMFIKTTNSKDSKILVSKNIRKIGFDIKNENWQENTPNNLNLSVWKSGFRISGIKFKGVSNNGKL